MVTLPQNNSETTYLQCLLGRWKEHGGDKKKTPEVSQHGHYLELYTDHLKDNHTDLTTCKRDSHIPTSPHETQSPHTRVHTTHATETDILLYLHNKLTRASF